VDEALARVACELGRRYLRSHDLSIPDLIVAATAKLTGLLLATSNVMRFPMFPRLKSPC
jgi:predicted nucleic acid-binding protein